RRGRQAFYTRILTAKLFERREQDRVVYGSIAGIEHRSEPMRKVGLELAQLRGVEPATRRKRGFCQSFYSFFTECDLDNSPPIERNLDACSLGQEFNKRWISIPGCDTEIGRRARRAFDG